MYYSRSIDINKVRVVCYGNFKQVYSLNLYQKQFLTFVGIFYLLRGGFFTNSVQILVKAQGLFVTFSVFKSGEFLRKDLNVGIFLVVLQKVFQVTLQINTPVFLKLKVLNERGVVSDKKYLFKGSQDLVELLRLVFDKPIASAFCSFISFLLEKTSRHQIIIDFVGNQFESLFNLPNKNLKGYKVIFKGRWNGVDRSVTQVFIKGYIGQQVCVSKLDIGFAECVTPGGVCSVKVILNYG